MKFLFSFILSLLLISTAKAEDVLLTPKNTVIFRGVVDDNSTLAIQLKLIQLVVERGNQDYPIYLVIRSGGGSVPDGNDFIQFAKKIKNLKTITQFAASMASAIVEQLPGERLITENGILMFHRAKGQFEGQFEEGEVEAQLNLWKSIIRGMEQKNSSRMGISLKTYKARVANEWWLDSSQAIKSKAADKIVDIVCSQELVEQKVSASQETPFGSLELEFSGCPLFTVPVGTKEN